MKKFMTMFLVFALVACMTTGVFAAEKENPIRALGNYDEKDVNIKITTTGSHTDVYSVTVEWDVLDFTYSFHGSETWNPETHTYSTSSAGSWDKTSADIKVTNHSNKAVQINSTFVTANGVSSTVNGVTAQLTNASFELAAGELNKYAEADNKTIKVTVDGTPTKTSEFKLDTVRVTVSAV